MKKLLVALLTFGLMLTGCSGNKTEDTGNASSDVLTAQGTGKGIAGDVVVEVTVTGDKITKIEVVEQNETVGIGSVACEQLPDKIVAANSVAVDAIASATVTSDAIKEAVLDAIKTMGLNPDDFSKEVEKVENTNKTEVTLDCDVVIVGAGGAGLTAAASLVDAGVTNVIVLEKMPLVGGNSLKASGGMNAAGTKYQTEEDGTVETFIEDTMKGGHDINNIDLVTTMAENSSDAIDWLGTIGADLPVVAATGGTTHKYLHEPEDGSAVGSYLIDKLDAYCSSKDVNVMLNTEATEIINVDGAAAGVIANDDDNIYTINAKAVIIATGGFGANFELMASYNPSLANAVTTNAAGATGDGIAMAQEAFDAATVDMEYIQLHPTVYQADGTLVSERLRSNGAILVNNSGKRFTNDLATRDAVSNAELEQDGAYAYICFDSTYTEEKLYQKYIKGGLTVQGDTLEELAANMGLEGDAVTNFVATVEAWNTTCDTGEDEFGRNNGLEKMVNAPYYAIQIAPGIHHTMGGLEIDTEAQVINTAGEVIPGLFAAGETTGGVHGGNRIGGNAVCDFVVFGRIAAQSAMDYIAE